MVDAIKLKPSVFTYNILKNSWKQNYKVSLKHQGDTAYTTNGSKFTPK